MASRQYQNQKTDHIFLTFEMVEKAENAMELLLENNVYSKYLQYHVFFKLSNVDENLTYNNIKQEMIKRILEFDPDSSILYYKLKRSDEKLTGCGDFVVDTIDTQKKL
jgi:hypothetical protein